MGEEDAGVDEGPVAELWENFKEAVDAGRFDEEAEERAGGAGQSPTIALESSLLCEEADAAGGLALSSGGRARALSRSSGAIASRTPSLTGKAARSEEKELLARAMSRVSEPASSRKSSARKSGTLPPPR